MVANFLTQSYLSYKGLFLWLNWWSYISNVFLSPFFYVVMFTLVGRFTGNKEAAEAYIIGMAAYAIPTILLGGILQSFFYDRSFGTLSLLFGSSGSRLVAYLSRGVLHYPNGIFSVASSIFFAYIFLGLDISRADWLTMSVSMALMTFSCTTFALFVGNFAIIFRVWMVLIYVSSGILMALTGVVIPTNSLPGFLGGIGQFLPLTNGLIALRSAFVGAAVTAEVDVLLRELMIGLGYAIAGFLFFRIVETRAKRDGVYDAVN